MNNKLIISWDEYNKTVEKLALKVHNSGFKVDLLIGISRGRSLPLTTCFGIRIVVGVKS